MTTSKTLISFVVMLSVALLALLPLRLVLAAAGPGLTAREASGGAWAGRLAAAQWHGVPLGDLAVGIAPLPLLAGRVELAIAGPALRGRLVRGVGVEGLTGSVAVTGLTLLPVAAVAFEGVDISFAGGDCRTARGVIRVKPGGAFGAGRAAEGWLSGSPRCEAGQLRVAFVPAAGAGSRIDLAVGGDGRYRAGIAIEAPPETARDGLLASGFQPTPRGLALQLEGSL